MTEARRLCAVLLPILLAMSGLGTSDGSVADGRAADESGPLATLEAFMAAFNDHDPTAMKALLAPDAGWHSVAGAELVTEAETRDELIEGMKRYFADVPDVQATIEEPVVDGSRVAFRERVTWGDGNRAQTALAVYQVEGDRISRAWYFAANP